MEMTNLGLMGIPIVGRDYKSEFYMLPEPGKSRLENCSSSLFGREFEVFGHDFDGMFGKNF
eukprot:scaffold18058_cov64-Cylindrotheca_fusiformis.AAC.1